MSVSAAGGLRERKRVKTSHAIHVAALELVLERGLDAATIDAISDRAEVSSRTFFNYFPSKEDALLGVDEDAISAVLDQQRDTPDDLLTGVFDLLYSLFESSGGQRTNPDLTREVLQRYPQLMMRQMLRIAEVEGRLSEILAGWLATDPRFASDSERERTAQARMIIGICLATVRVSMKRWSSESEAHPGSTASLDPRQTYEQSIATLRTVMERLT